ncbi:MAG: hypothetical protein SOR57_06910 [Parabacteroides sp.]|nr:hypothetical protein [Parabacteroides sp.]
MGKTLIFISWSKPLGKQVAHVLKKFLTTVFDLKRETDVFVSSKNLTGNDRGWFEELRKQASAASIFIPCMTKESINSPWLHFETGIGTSMKGFPTKVIPFLFNVSIDEFGDRLEMYKHNQMIHSDIAESKRMYKDLLCQLIYYISAFLYKEKNEIKEIFNVDFCCHNYESFNPEQILKHHNYAIQIAIKELAGVAKLYDTRDFYISRPIQGISPEYSEKYERVLKEMELEAKEQSYRSFRGYSKTKESMDSISYYRMGILKQAHYFVLIYPVIEGDKIPPSSCLIELGGAIAYGKNIAMFIQKGAILPAFMKDLITMKKGYYEYSDTEDLRRQWSRFLKDLKEE